jgi:hypothetical protein
MTGIGKRDSKSYLSTDSPVKAAWVISVVRIWPVAAVGWLNGAGHRSKSVFDPKRTLE